MHLRGLLLVKDLIKLVSPHPEGGSRTSDCDFLQWSLSFRQIGEGGKERKRGAAELYVCRSRTHVLPTLAWSLTQWTIPAVAGFIICIQLNEPGTFMNATARPVTCIHVHRTGRLHGRALPLSNPFQCGALTCIKVIA